MEPDSTLLKHQKDRVSGQYLRLRVKDTGEGLDAELIKRIFDPFFTTKKKGKGTGLGLAVVHGIVEGHHGLIHVEGKPNQGAVFDIYLPVIESNVLLGAKKESTLVRGKERILMEEDEIVKVEVGKKIFEKMGYKVTAFTSSLDALLSFKKDPDQFDLVITDMTMPQMTGDIMAREILKLRPQMKIILCTGYSERINAEKAIKLGISRYVEKPVTHAEFLKIIRELLDEK